jgi:ABC-type transport system involved in multi-copper enzyme maturation permease subunit
MGTALVIAQNTISEALRRKVLNAFAMVGVAVMVLMFAFQQFAPRQEMTLVKGMGLGIISLAGIFITIILTINMIPTEVERRTIYTILSKPVRRYEFLLGKFLGAIGTIGINVGLMSVVFVLAVLVKQVMGGTPMAAALPNSLELFKGIIMIYMQLVLLAAVGMFFSVFLTPLVNFFLTVSLFIIGNMSSFTQDLSQNNKNPIVKGFFALIHYLVPNFGNFQYSNPLLQPDVVVKSEVLFLSQNVVYAIVYSTVLLILGILAFDRREV